MGLEDCHPLGLALGLRGDLQLMVALLGELAQPAQGQPETSPGRQQRRGRQADRDLAEVARASPRTGSASARPEATAGILKPEEVFSLTGTPGSGASHTAEEINSSDTGHATTLKNQPTSVASRPLNSAFVSPTTLFAAGQRDQIPARPPPPRGQHHDAQGRQAEQQRVADRISRLTAASSLPPPEAATIQ